MAMKKTKASKTPARAKPAARAKTAAKEMKKVVAKVKKVVAKVRAKVAPVPKGYHTATPSMVVRGGAQAIEFYKKAFGAKVVGRPMLDPAGKVMHAELKIGDSIFMLGDEMPEWGLKSPQTIGGTASSIMIYTRDADALFNQAISAGAKVAMPLENAFWGDRYGKLEDPFGHQWAIATRKENLSAKQMEKRGMEAFAQMGAK